MEEPLEEEIHLRDYLRVILKHRWTVITVFAVIVIMVTIHSFTATPIYEASTRLVIEKENPKVVSIQEVMAVDASGTDYYQTQYKIIESRAVARDVLRRFSPADREKLFPKPEDGVISDFKQTIQGWIASIRSLLKTTDGEGAGQITGEGSEENERVSGLIRRIKVNPIRNSRLVDVNFEAEDPVLAAKVVNTIAAAYIDQNLETKLAAVQNAVKWLHSRIEEERKKVEEAQQALLRYKEEHGIITDFTSDVEKITAQKLAEMNTQVVEAESKRVEAETRYKQAAALAGSPDMLGSIPEVLDNELIQNIKSMEVELYKRMSELSKKYGQKHPRMLAIESEIKTLQERKTQEVNRVISSLRNEYRVALAREESLKAALAQQKKESLDLNQKAIQYSVLQREAESARHMYDLLIKRFKETALTEDMKTGNIRVIDRAEVPKDPVKPRRQRNILLAIIVGLLTGTGLAFFFEYLDNTIKIPEDVKRHLRIPYLGPVPLFETASKGNPRQAVNQDLVTLHDSKSTASESYRGIRTNILFSSAESAPQVILITSAGPREGKTITALNLGVTMAQAGSKVMLLDCDMRRPKIHKAFGLAKDRGISNLLVGGEAADGAFRHTPIPNLDIIPCGPIPPNPSEMLGSKRMSDLLNRLRKEYAHILIDSPPSTAVTDPAVLSKSVDGVVLVIRAGDTAKEMVKNGIGQFQAVGARILGAILNGVDIGRDKYYYYYQYYHYYYGEDGDRKKRKNRTKKSKHQHGE
ncbi:MAG: polysaccharide biosynthesis tyrosine autokinase [Desulfobacterales bacterium]|nr:MAG: polysaccharide biosynthesis tyrosine autokinase [Desulfobacterales bacterium]